MLRGTICLWCIIARWSNYRERDSNQEKILNSKKLDIWICFKIGLSVTIYISHWTSWHDWKCRLTSRYCLFGSEVALKAICHYLLKCVWSLNFNTTQFLVISVPTLPVEEEGLTHAAAARLVCNVSCDEMIPTPEPPSTLPVATQTLHIPPGYNAGYCLTPA